MIAKAAFAATQISKARGFSPFRRSHLSEVLAGLLGYRTLAAFQAEESDASADYHLDDAEHLVLNLPLAMARATRLALEDSIVPLCIEALKSVVTANVFEGVDDFYDSFAREQLEDGIASADDTATAMAECNANFYETPELSIETPATQDLWTSRDEWTLEAFGTISGNYDAEGDRMYNGSSLNCGGRLVFQKAGRAGLVLIDFDGGAAVDDSWRDQDYENEQAYWADREKSS